MRRRKLIKAGGIALTGTMLTSTASAGFNAEKLKQIDEEVFQAYINGGERSVNELMEQNSLNNKISSGTDNITTKEGEVTADGIYTGIESDMLNVFEDPDGNNRIRVQVVAKLKDLQEYAGFANWSEDVIAISYDSDHWSKVGESSRQMSPDVGSVELFSGSTEGGGAFSIVDFDSLPEDGVNILLAHSLENDSGTAGTVYGSYVHSWAYSPGVSVNNIVAGPGPLSVDFDGSIKSDWQWTEDSSTDGLI